MKKIFITTQLSSGQLAQCEFTSDKPWVSFNANDTIDQTAVPVRIYKAEFADPNGMFNKEWP